MHYFIDGYNLLFRLMHNNEDLQSQREAIIQDLNQKVSLIKLDVSIVFDAVSQIGERARLHYNALEILFTAEGETADDYILDELKNHPHPQQETVITSDKALAWRVRGCSAHTESVENFMFWLNRAYKNKKRRLQKEKYKLAVPPASAPPQPTPSASRSLIPSQDARLEAYTDYYAQIFESELQKIEREAERKQTQESLPILKPHPRRPKKKRDPFAVQQTSEEKAATEMERWLNLFEKRLEIDKNLKDSKDS